MSVSSSPLHTIQFANLPEKLSLSLIPKEICQILMLETHSLGKLRIGPILVR